MKKIKPRKEDEFIIDGDVIICYSKNGNKYTLTKDEHCTCHSFSFHSQCRHIDEAKECGLFEELIEQTKKVAADPMSFRNSPVVQKERIKAIMAYLTKQNISANDEKINAIELKLTLQTKPEELLEWARYPHFL